MFGEQPIPYEGYYFRILKAQGPNANGGAKSYIESGRMTGGFGFIAWPAIFGSSGIMTRAVQRSIHLSEKGEFAAQQLGEKRAGQRCRIPARQNL